MPLIPTLRGRSTESEANPVYISQGYTVKPCLKKINIAGQQHTIGMPRLWVQSPAPRENVLSRKQKQQHPLFITLTLVLLVFPFVCVYIHAEARGI